MIGIALSLALGFTLQDAQQPRLPAMDVNPYPRPESAAEMQPRGPKLSPSTPEALRAIQQFGTCVADTSTDKARRTLNGDFRSPAFHRAVDQLVEANRDCPSFRGYNRLRASRLLFSGAVAERLIERDGTALNRALAAAAAKPAAATYSDTDSGAMCVVRSVPDDVAKLFASDVATPAEKQAADALQPAMAMCMQSRRVEISTDGLRAMLATAAFRSIAAADPALARS